MIVEQLTEENILNLKTLGFLICKTKFLNWVDKLSSIKTQIQNDYEIEIPDWIKIDKKTMIHIFDAHWYDTEMNTWLSIKPFHITRLIDVLESYDNLQENSVIGNSNWQRHIRYLLKKEYDWRIYNLVIEVDKNNKVCPNQLKLITMYINDFLGEWQFDILKTRNMVASERKRLKKQYGDRYI